MNSAGTPERLQVLLSGSWDEAEQQVWHEALRAACPDVDWHLRAPIHGAVQVAVVANPPPGALQGLPDLRLIQSLWAGVDRLLADPTLPAGVPVARMVDPAMTLAMAETALWAVLSLHRGFFDYAEQQRRGQWRQLPQRRADEIGVLVLGLGQMGQAVARSLAQRGYPVTGWSRLPPAAPGPAESWAGVQAVAGPGALACALPAAHIVVNTLPLTPATRGILDASFLRALPAGASLVNLARGAHLVEADLLQALDSGRLARAVLDVFAAEPLPAQHPFWSHPKVSVLPHVAALTDPRSAAQVVAANLRRLAAGEPLLHLVHRERGY